MKQPTKSAIRLRELDRANTVLQLALHDLASGAVHWIHRLDYSIGISRASGAAGGLAIVKAFGSVSAHYWEELYPATMASIAACMNGEDSEHQRELFRRRSCLEEACRYVRGAQRMAA